MNVMEKEALIGECMVIACFLENIHTDDKERMKRLLTALRNYSEEELQKYYTINSHIKELRIKRILNRIS